ncbi:hypothetical protein DRB06_05875 [Actinomyces sp. Z5]|uniref:restriction system modified-DNA reader domain-containing protein n=1 Tax=Actinomyces sp. Z5 TaxID=2250216 RepID=UPI000DCCFC6F|nr:DUF262 domain-containing protein [Actinomyces sp. Z5]RAX21485.1 hypothetical protein DRB06_05875 [Actinomyces sp. Z5]
MITELAIPQDLFALTMRLDAPLFQRPYVWNQEDQWAPLWEDIRTLAEAWLDPHAPGPGNARRPAEPHFLGAVVLQDRNTLLTEEVLAIWPTPAGHVHHAPRRALSVNNATMKDLLDAGLLAVGDELVGVGRDEETRGGVDAAGRLVFEGVTYAAPSTPASQVRGTSTNGWTFWRLGSLDGPTLDELRARLLASHE